MAGKDDDDSISVNIDDLDTVQVEVDDEASTPAGVVKEAKTPKEPRVRKNTTPRIDPDAPTPEQALLDAQAFGKQQEEARKAAEATAASERNLREQAQRQATQAQADAETQRERASNSELTVIENSIAAAQRELEAQEGEYTRAAEAGEFSKMASIQTKISRAAAALDRLENAKSTFDVSKTTQTTEGRVEATQPQGNVFEQYLSQFAPAAQTWLRQHPDCIPANVGGDATKNSKMMAGHYAALANNIALNTPEYFKVIEEHVSPAIQQATTPPPTSKAADIQTAEAPKPRQAQPSAPVSRDAPTGQAPRSVREVRLSKDQQEMAKVSFPHLPEAQAFGQYARNLLELEAEGKLGRVTH